MKRLLLLLLVIPSLVFAQTDTAQFNFKPTDSLTTIEKRKTLWNKQNIIKASIAPALLIGYGISTIKDNGFYSSYQAKKDILRLTNNPEGRHKYGIDDYLIFAPYFMLGGANLIKLKCKNDFLNLALLTVKSELIMTAIVFPVKKLTAQVRPDGSDSLSFPSGHTAHAFLAATILHNEYKDTRPWISVVGYGVATSVAAFRMINNKHWQSDVFAGAGVGILSAHIAYLTHRFRWGKNTCLVPTYSPNYGGGMAMVTTLGGGTGTKKRIH